MTSKYTKAAKGQECLVRIPGVCNFDPDTTVFAHLPSGGWAMKSRDIFGAFACSDCHDALDGRRKCEWRSVTLSLMHYEAVERTQNKLIDMGILIL